MRSGIQDMVPWNDQAACPLYCEILRVSIIVATFYSPTTNLSIGEPRFGLAVNIRSIGPITRSKIYFWHETYMWHYVTDVDMYDLTIALSYSLVTLNLSHFHHLQAWFAIGHDCGRKRRRWISHFGSGLLISLQSLYSSIHINSFRSHSLPFRASRLRVRKGQTSFGMFRCTFFKALLYWRYLPVFEFGRGLEWTIVALTTLTTPKSLLTRSGLWFDTNRSVTVHPRITGARPG